MDPSTSRDAKADGRLALVLAAGACALLWLSAPLALLAGGVLSLGLAPRTAQIARVLSHRLLACSLVGLGAQIELGELARVGSTGLLLAALTIALSFAAGSWLAGRLRVESDVGWLVIAGTAVCGGSAIAALAPVLRAKAQHVSMALATVFLFNTLALLVLPWAGRALDLSPDAYGRWCALAIHDTASVIAAAEPFGAQAVQIASTSKLARALWIVPIVICMARRGSRDLTGSPTLRARPRLPWFVVGFVLSAALFSLIPGAHEFGRAIAGGAQRTIVLSLFLVGLSLSREGLRAAGWRPLGLGALLWLGLCLVSLLAVA